MGSNIATKDRWRWKRVLKWLGGGLLVLVGVGAAGGYAWYRYDQHIAPKEQFADVWLGARPEDVLFKRGEPTERDPSDKDDFWVYKLRGGYPETERGTINIKFKDGQVKRIWYLGEYLEAPSIHPAPSIGATLESLEERLGKSAAVSISKDGLARMVAYPDKKLMYYLHQNKAVGVGIFDPADGTPKFKEELK